MRKRIRKEINRSGFGRCEVPGCNNQGILTEHHIRGRNIPGWNKPSNKCNICSNCHTDIHNDRLVIEAWVMTTCGLVLMVHKKGEESFTGDDAAPHVIRTRPSSGTASSSDSGKAGS